MPYDFLIDTYETERVKVVSVWSEFTDADLRCARIRAILEAAACTGRIDRQSGWTVWIPQRQNTL